MFMHMVCFSLLYKYIFLLLAGKVYNIKCIHYNSIKNNVLHNNKTLKNINLMMYYFYNILY